MLSMCTSVGEKQLCNDREISPTATNWCSTVLTPAGHVVQATALALAGLARECQELKESIIRSQKGQKEEREKESGEGSESFK